MCQPISGQDKYCTGRSLAASLLQNNDLYGDSKSPLENNVSKIGNTLAMASDLPEAYQGYRFIVLQSQTINAFAVPSGYIFITPGLIQLASSETN